MFIVCHFQMEKSVKTCKNMNTLGVWIMHKVLAIKLALARQKSPPFHSKKLKHFQNKTKRY